MNKYFNYYNSLCTGVNTPTIFTSDPYITAVKSLLAQEIKQIVYYIEKLKDLNEDMSIYRDKVIEFVSVLLFNSDFKRESFFVIIEDLYKNKLKLKKLYGDKCLSKGLAAEFLACSDVDLTSKKEVLKMLNEREQNITKDTINLSDKRKVLYSIITNLVLNACNCLIELKNYGEVTDEEKDAVLSLINSANYPVNDDKELKEKIKEFSCHNYLLMKKLYNAAVKNFGPVIKHKIPFSVKKGKAILVSGSSLSDLKKILDTVEGGDVNVYTHNETIRAFKYETFKKYKNLAGHYQLYGNNFREEFAAFPGAVYLSVNSIPKIDVIRGQIYTGAKYPEFGIGKIENCDYSLLASVARKSSGICENKTEASRNTGYDINELNGKISEIAELYNSNKINHICIPCITDMFNSENEYLKELIKKCDKSVFLISFSYNSERENFWHAEDFLDYSMLYYIIENLKKEIENITENMSVIIADCSMNTISHLFNLSYLKVKNIFTGPCCPNIINPVIMSGLNDEFGFRELSDVETDLKIITKKKEA